MGRRRRRWWWWWTATWAKGSSNGEDALMCARAYECAQLVHMSVLLNYIDSNSDSHSAYTYSMYGLCTCTVHIDWRWTALHSLVLSRPARVFASFFLMPNPFEWCELCVICWLIVIVGRLKVMQPHRRRNNKIKKNIHCTRWVLLCRTSPSSFFVQVIFRVCCV